jgi:restriction endonuclease S subunit
MFNIAQFEKKGNTSSWNELFVALLSSILSFHYMNNTTIHRNLAIIVIDTVEKSKFVYSYMKSSSFQKQIEMSTYGSTQSLLNLSDLREFYVLVPGIDTEIKSINNIIKIHELTITKEEAYLEKLKLQKKD